MPQLAQQSCLTRCRRRASKAPYKMQDHWNVSSKFDGLPEEIVMNILQFHLDVTRMPISSPVDLTCAGTPLQVRYVMQTSLCRVSKRFYRCASHLIRRNGLLRVTCWLNPHLHFYHLFPTVCRADRADMFQIPSPHLTIHLAHGLTDAVCVRSVVSVHQVSSLLAIVRLHHAAGLILLPSVYDVSDVKDHIEFELSSAAGTEQQYVGSAESSMLNQLPGLARLGDNGEMSRYMASEQTTAIVAPQILLWTAAFRMGRILFISPEHRDRRLGLKVTRYLLVSMLFVTNPWKQAVAGRGVLDAYLRLTALVSAALIDALVVEPELFRIFYADDSLNAGVIYTFHHEVCPCRYLPRGTESGETYGFAKTDETWTWIQVAMHFLHSTLLHSEGSRRVRIEGLRNIERTMGQDASTARSRCRIYIDALERYQLSPNCYCSLSSNSGASPYFPPISDA